jgi:hypothetical protein
MMAEMITKGRELNQNLKPKTPVSFREGPGHDGRGGEWKGEWRGRGHMHTKITTLNTDTLEGKF